MKNKWLQIGTFIALAFAFTPLHGQKPQNKPSSQVQLKEQIIGDKSTPKSNVFLFDDQAQIQERVIGNTYVVGGNISVDAEISGDLIGMGGDIDVRKPIQQDILLLGGEVRIDAKSGQDLRIAGGSIHITQSVAGDLNIAGGEVIIAKGVVINGDVLIAGGEVQIDGNIAGDLRIIGGEVTLRGAVGGILSAHTGELYLQGQVKGPSKIIAQSIHLSEQARFEGDVIYWTNGAKPDFSSTLIQDAQARFDNTLKPQYANIDWEKTTKTGFLGFTFFRLASGLLLTFLFLGFFARFFETRAGLARQRMSASMMRGYSFLLLLPFLSTIALMTVIGIPVGLVGFSVFTAIVLSVNALAAIVIAYELAAFKNWPFHTGRMALLSAGIFLLFRGVGFLPFIGQLINFIIAAIALGHISRQFNYRKPAEPTPAPEPESDLV